jgi:redox-sensitive bicupin YhaK (pirin superfamily)
VTLLDVELVEGAVLHVAVPAVRNAVVLVVSGALTAGGTGLPTHGVAALDGPEDRFELRADEASVCLVLTGEPIAEPVVFGGPFCMTDDADLADARRRFAAGQMGHLAPSF